jgi:heme/copper-type cytochrome/quinol oxidase subunit 1
MNQILNKPYKSIWWSIPIVLGLSIIGFNSAIDFEMHDTYLVISSIHIGILFSILLGIIGLMYWLIRKKRLVDWMTAIHVTSTIIIFVLIVLTGLIFKKVIESDFKIFRTVNQIMFIIILIAMLSQLVFIANLLFSLIKNKQKD